MGSTRQYPGGIRLANEGERLSFQDLINLANLGNRSALHLLAEILRDALGSAPASGFFGSSCKVTSSGGLNYSIATGYGLYYDAAATSDWLTHYSVIANIATVNGTHAAHEANPRWDIISLAPNTLDDESEVDQVRDPATGTITPTTIYTRRRWHRTVTVTKGTAAAVPSVPATPAGHIKIAEVWVPATSGDVVVYDVRPRIMLGQDLARGLAGPGAFADCVPGTGDELLVEADGGGMYVFVDAANGAEFFYEGYRYHGAPGRKAVTASDATHDRIDLVEMHYEGYLVVWAGTPATPPAAPSPSGDGVVLAEVYVTAGATVINPVNVTDLRERAPIATQQIQDGAVTEDQIGNNEVTQRKMAVKIAIPDISVGAESSDVISVGIQIRDAAGNAIAEVVRCRARVLGATGRPEDDPTEYTLAITTGTTALPTNPPMIASYGVMVFDTTADGEAAFDITDVVGAQGGVWLLIEVLNRPGTPAIADLGFDWS